MRLLKTARSFPLGGFPPAPRPALVENRAVPLGGDAADDLEVAVALRHVAGGNAVLVGKLRAVQRGRIAQMML